MPLFLVDLPRWPPTCTGSSVYLCVQSLLEYTVRLHNNRRLQNVKNVQVIMETGVFLWKIVLWM